MMDEQTQGDLVHALALGEGERAAHEAAQTLAQGAVPTLHVAGLPLVFAAEPMRAPRKRFFVGQPEVAARGAAAVIGRDARTQSPGAVRRAVAHKIGDDLPRLPAEGNPEPTRIGFGADKAPKFVEFEHVTRLGRQKGVAQRREVLGFFSSHLATVCRATPKTRSAARRLRRSTSTARRISVLRAGSMAGLLAASTRCAPQALQRNCWVPAPLWPALTMDVLPQVAQQRAELFTPDHHRKSPFVTQSITTTCR